MKKFILTIVFTCCCLFLNSCKEELDEKQETCACEITDPAKNLPWLAELIEKAGNDKTGNYYGVIWLEKYKGQDVFVTNMMLGSGGVAYYVFDCEGNYVSIEKPTLDFFNNLKKEIVIYVHPDYPLNL